MKAIQITKPGEIKVIEKDMPKRKEGEALLKVLYCGICGADVASFTGNQPFTTYPRIPGMTGKKRNPFPIRGRFHGVFTPTAPTITDRQKSPDRKGKSLQTRQLWKNI